MAIGEMLGKVFARSDRDVLQKVVAQADKMSPAEIQGHVDEANRSGKVDLAFLLGSLKYAKEAWDKLAFWTQKAPDVKAGEVLLEQKALPGNWQAYDRFGSISDVNPKLTKAAAKRPDGLVNQQELLQGIVNDRAAELGIRQLRFTTPASRTRV